MDRSRGNTSCLLLLLLPSLSLGRDDNAYLVYQPVVVGVEPAIAANIRETTLIPRDLHRLTPWAGFRNRGVYATQLHRLL